MKKIFLPDAEIEISAKNILPPLFFVAGGRKPDLPWFKEAAGKNNASVWAVDKGIEVCHDTDIVPIRLTGDNDSAAKSAWEWAKKKRVKTDCFDRAKDRTDFQLALEISKSVYAGNIIIVTGCFGGRLDHQFSLLHSLAADARSVIAADEKEILIILHGGDTANIKINLPPIGKNKSIVISLLPFSAACENVNIHGVRWPLANASLTQNNPYAVSNELTAQSGGNFSVGLTGGTLGVYISRP